MIVGDYKSKNLHIIGTRSKKYVKLNIADRVTASGKIITESGSKAKANKTGLYKRWKEKSHSKISFQGPNNEGGRAMESTSLEGGGRRMQGGFRGGNKQK